MLSNLTASIVKVLGSFIAGIGAGFLTVGIFALQLPERWQFELINRRGPPFGPFMLALGVGLLTTMLLLVVLFWQTWRRKAREGSFLRGTMVKILASLVGGAGTGLVVLGVFALRDPDLWEFDGPRHSPPAGPILLASGIGFLTAALLMAILFWGSGRRPAPEVAVTELEPELPKSGRPIVENIAPVGE